jgi:hypothetical protein
MEPDPDHGGLTAARFSFLKAANDEIIPAF